MGIQGFVDLHRPDAVRILDFPHAMEHVVWRMVCTAVSPADSASCGPQSAEPSPTGLPLAPFPYWPGLLPTAQSDYHCKTVTHTSAANIWGSQGIVIQSVDLQ